MKILLPFFDDSTLIFAVKIGAELRKDGNSTVFLHLREEDEQENLSDRQIDEYLGEVSYQSINVTEFWVFVDSGTFDAVILCKVPPIVNQRLGNPVYAGRRDRPCIVAFQPGIELTPERGFKNRKNMDVLFLFRESHINHFRRWSNSTEQQYVTYGHPYSILENKIQSIGGDDIVFFAQAICPSTLKARVFMARLLNELAHRHSDRQVCIKLRHLPGENANHTHKERFDYPSIVNYYIDDRARNLEIISCSMSEALNRASATLTCSSTAFIDSLSAGVPTMLYTEYPESYRDNLALLLRREFQDCGLFVGIADIMRLSLPKINPEWMAGVFRGRMEMYDELYFSIREFRARSH